MNMNFTFLQANQAAQGQGSMMPMLIMLVAMFVIMYFFMIRPQKKRQKELQQWRNSLQVGTEVVLAGGIRGKIKDLNPEKSYMIVEIAKGVNIEVDRNSVYADMEQQMQK
ncbi:MAG: preprotein translocase subunit YajC [Bacteroidaceae bacterium]